MYLPCCISLKESNIIVADSLAQRHNATTPQRIEDQANITVVFVVALCEINMRFPLITPSAAFR